MWNLELPCAWQAFQWWAGSHSDDLYCNIHRSTLKHDSLSCTTNGSLISARNSIIWTWGNYCVYNLHTTHTWCTESPLQLSVTLIARFIANLISYIVKPTSSYYLLLEHFKYVESATLMIIHLHSEKRKYSKRKHCISLRTGLLKVG